MIAIKVGGKSLYIPKDTALVLEVNNNVFENDGYIDDIVWTFELPAKPNQAVLGAVQYVYTGGRKRYDCELTVDGVPFMRGILYVQTASDEKRLECGIVANSFGVGFGERMLKDNDYGDDITIAAREADHQSGWIAFLQASLAAESVYKFFLFADESFYGDNEDFGYHLDNISGLIGKVNTDQFCKYVNRLFFDANGNIIQNPDRDSNNALVRQGVRIFNTNHTGKRNGYCFAPALRLDWLVRKVIQNAGMTSTGSFFAEKRIHRLFSQSLNAMDGEVFQYGVSTWLHVGGNINLYEDSITNGQKFNVDADSESHACFGWISGVNVGFRLLLPVEELVRNSTDTSDITGDPIYHWRDNVKYVDEIYAIVISTKTASLPSIRMSLNMTEGDGTPVFKYGRPMTTMEIKRAIDNDDPDSVNIEHVWSVGGGTGNVEYYGTWGALITHKKTVPLVHTTNATLVQLTASRSKNVFFSGALGGYTEGSVLQRMTNDVASTERQFLRLVKCKIGTMKGDVYCPWSIDKMNVAEYGRWEVVYGYEFQSDLAIDTTDTPLNIFTNVLRWRDHVPNLSNGEFLSRICKLFGLNMFANPMTKEVQLSFFSDVMQAQSFDISQWVTSEERMEYQPKEYQVRITPALSTKSVAESNIIDEADNADSLPPAVTNKNKHAYVKAEKAYRRSTIIQDTSRFRWEQSGGDDRCLAAGAGDSEETEEVKIEANVPNMRMVDEELAKTKRKYICELNVGGNSPLLDEDYSGEFDFVLQQYHGHRLLSLPDGVTTTEAYIEDANPTQYTDGISSNVDSAYLDLSTGGKGSIGQQWLRPLYQFLGNCERYRFTAYLPTWAFQKVYALLKPQSGSPAQQTRWLQIKSNRYMPIKMSFEIGSSRYVVATIECAAPHVDI